MASLLEERRKMLFEDVHSVWTERRLTREEAARLLGASARTFRRWSARYEADGIEGLRDRRLSRASHRAAPVDEVMRMVDRYRTRHEGWNVRHFYSWCRRDGGTRGYGWVKDHLRKAGAVGKSKGRGRHRGRREPAPWPGMPPHRDGSDHAWVEGSRRDLIVTMDDATNEHYSMFLCEEEGTRSSFRGVRETIEAKGLFCSLYTDRGSHYRDTPEAGGKVDRDNPTQFGRAMARLGIEMIPAYSPEARGRSERAFGTHRGRLPRELAAAGIADMESANRYLREVCLPAFNAEFARPAREDGSAFVPCADPAALDDILCEIHERVVGRDNCVRFERRVPQLPADRHRPHHARARAKVRRHADGTLSVRHGPRKLARYDSGGGRLADGLPVAAWQRSSWGCPPLAHRASCTSGTGAVDKAWTTPPPALPRSGGGSAERFYSTGPTLKPCPRGPAAGPDSSFVLEADTSIC